MISWVLVFTLVVSGRPPTIVQHTVDISGIVYTSKAECQKAAENLWSNLTYKQDGLRMAITKYAECVPQKKEQS